MEPPSLTVVFRHTQAQVQRLTLTLTRTPTLTLTLTLILTLILTLTLTPIRGGDHSPDATWIELSSGLGLDILS